MNPKIIDYQTVYVVNMLGYLRDGWVPQGGAYFDKGGMEKQAMVKYEDPDRVTFTEMANLEHEETVRKQTSMRLYSALLATNVLLKEMIDEDNHPISRIVERHAKNEKVLTPESDECGSIPMTTTDPYTEELSRLEKERESWPEDKRRLYEAVMHQLTENLKA